MGCLFVGKRSGHDAVWAFEAQHHTISQVKAPGSRTSPGEGIEGVDCMRSVGCVVADATPGEQSIIRLSTTMDGGVSWSPPRWDPGTFHTPSSSTLDGFSCASVLDCLAVNAGACGCGFLAEYTLSGGTTWTVGFSSRNYPYATSLSCASLARCIYVTANPGLEATSNFGKSWHPQAPPSLYDPYMVTCATGTRCLLVLNGYFKERGKWGVAIGPVGGWRLIRTLRTSTSPHDSSTSFSCGPRWCALLISTQPMTFRE